MFTVHAELRPFPARMGGEAQLAFILLDDWTRYMWVAFVSEPHAILTWFINWYNQRKAEGFTVRRVQCGVFMAGMPRFMDDFASRLSIMGIDADRGVYAPNVEADEAFTDVCLKAFDFVTGKHSRSIPTDVWKEMLEACVYLYNRCPSPKLTFATIGMPYVTPPPSGRYTTPHERLYGTIPDIAHLRILGSTAWIPSSDVSETSLVRGTLVGYVGAGPRGNGQEYYRVWDAKYGVREVPIADTVVDESWPLALADVPERTEWEQAFDMHVRENIVFGNKKDKPTLPEKPQVKVEPAPAPPARDSGSARGGMTAARGGAQMRGKGPAGEAEEAVLDAVLDSGGALTASRKAGARANNPAVMCRLLSANMSGAY
ncbi:hypothetical protein IAT38_008345 [Cryptococcus sp. DSM 104549]